MTISEISIKNPVFAWMLMAAMIVFGAISLSRMGISQLPDVDFPVVTINVQDLGAPPETMETDVVDPIEGAVLQVPGVEDEVSQSINGSATITLTFDLDRNIDSALVDTENAVVSVENQLPTNIYPPTYSKTNPDDQPIMYLGLYSTDPTVTLRDLMIYVNDIAQGEFASVEGVGQVTESGYLQPELRVWPDDKKLAHYQLTVADIINTIQAEHIELPSGLLESPGRQDKNVQTLSRALTPQEFGNIFINARGGNVNYRPIPLSRVAEVTLGTADVLRVSRVEGQVCVGLGIIKQAGSNAVAVGSAVQARLNEMNKTMPRGMQVKVIYDSTDFVRQAVSDLEKNLVLAALATALVCWLFLGSWSATLNVVLAIPTSIVGTFTILYFSGFTLNTFTLLGLSLSIGIVVDDAIMVLENIVRHQEMGKGNVQASMDGARQITFAAVATSLAIVAIFLPVAFMSGVIGKYFYQFGITMVAAVALSLLEALTLTPMRCSQFVHVSSRTSAFGKAVERTLDWFAGLYARALPVALNHRWLVLIGALVFFVGSLFISLGLKKEFIPTQDQSVVFMSFKTPVGSSLAYTDTRMQLVERYLAKQPDVIKYYVSEGGRFGGQLNTGFGLATLLPKGHRPVDAQLGRQPTEADLMNRFRKDLSKVPDLTPIMIDLSTRGFTSSRGYAIEAGVRGPDWDMLQSSGMKLMQAMKDSGMMVDVDTDFAAGMPEVDVVPNRIEAAKRGVSVGTIAQTVNAMVGGENVGFYPRDGHEDYIEVRLTDSARTRQEQINDLLLRNDRGEVVPMKDVVTLKDISTLSQITRDKRQRTITLYASCAPGVSQDVALAKMQSLAKQILPRGYYIVMGQGSDVFTQTFHDLLFALFFGVIVAYMILASQFNSFIDPLTVLMALPFSASGALAGLWLWPYLTFNAQNALSLNIYSLIGMLLLMGIVKKNSIMLVDFTNEVRRIKKLPVREALLEACPVRYRPILMTSVAVMAAAVPEALGSGPGSETQVPMAVVLIFGVAVASVLTLFIVPCFYSVVAPLEGREAHQKLIEEAEDAIAAEAEEAKKGHGAKAPERV
ncbi:MAG TPA: efflux RND transporter permease subunit [bacterium]|nr:efflux RND transporter permease subunit [bacterium]